MSPLNSAAMVPTGEAMSSALAADPVASSRSAVPAATRSRRSPRPEILRWALLGTMALLALVGIDVHRYGGNNPVSLIQPGTKGPATAVIARDFPTLEQPGSPGLDGQMYYAIARDPLHLDQAAQSLDAPRYRLQRPLLPWLGWLLHPTGGGTGLITALFVVGLLATVAGAVATGMLSTWWRGPPWVAALFPILPGAYWSLRVTVSDALALALALLAVALATRSRYAPAVAVGVLAVLAKEPAILVLVGWALYRRTRRDLMLVAVPALAIVGWMAWLYVQVSAGPSRPQDLGLPLVGLFGAWTHIWSHGQELVGMACTVGAVAIGVFALVRRGLRHPLGWCIAVQLAFLSVMGRNPLGVNFGSTRTTMPIMILAVVALATPHAREVAVSAEWKWKRRGRGRPAVADPAGHPVPT